MPHNTMSSTRKKPKLSEVTIKQEIVDNVTTIRLATAPPPNTSLTLSQEEIKQETDSDSVIVPSPPIVDPKVVTEQKDNDDCAVCLNKELVKQEQSDNDNKCETMQKKDMDVEKKKKKKKDETESNSSNHPLTTEHVDLEDAPESTEKTKVDDQSTKSPESTGQVNHHHCPHCSIRFRTFSDLSWHLHAHKPSPSINRIWPCETCGKVLAAKSSLKKHCYDHPMQFRCPECNTFFPDNFWLQQHINMVHTKFPCLQCYKVFALEGHRKRHMAKCHKEDNT